MLQGSALGSLNLYDHNSAPLGNFPAPVSLVLRLTNMGHRTNRRFYSYPSYSLRRCVERDRSPVSGPQDASSAMPQGPWEAPRMMLLIRVVGAIQALRRTYRMSRSGRGGSGCSAAKTSRITFGTYAVSLASLVGHLPVPCTIWRASPYYGRRVLRQEIPTPPRILQNPQAL